MNEKTAKLLRKHEWWTRPKDEEDRAEWAKACADLRQKLATANHRERGRLRRWLFDNTVGKPRKAKAA